jgi:hypothetical protein
MYVPGTYSGKILPAFDNQTIALSRMGQRFWSYATVIRLPAIACSVSFGIRKMGVGTPWVAHLEQQRRRIIKVDLSELARCSRRVGEAIGGLRGIKAEMLF